MNRLARRARAAVTFAALAIGAMSVAAPYASASAVPFTDTNVQGWLTFCNRSGQQITSGSLDTVPFVWKAISSAQPPAGYRDSKGRATLYAFQPLQYVDPGDWAGSQLTAATVFSNPDHPVVQATNADSPLISFVQAYPPHWDGLVEIRMMWTAVNQSQLQFPYAAAIIRISGSTWSLVQGGNTSCSAGLGTSIETLSLPKKELAKESNASVDPKPATSAQATLTKTGAPSKGQAAGGSGASAEGKLAASTSSTGGMSAPVLAGIAVGALAVVWLGITFIARRRRRTAS
jgi:hypothetical protein